MNSAKIADNAVTTTDLADNAVTTTDLADNAVTTTDLADNAVTSAKVAADTLTDADLAPNSVGDSETAVNSVSSDELQAITVIEQTVSVPVPNGVNNIQVNCPANSQVISGGAFVANAQMDLVSNTVNGAGWFAAAQNDGAGAANLTVRAFCLAV